MVDPRIATEAANAIAGMVQRAADDHMARRTKGTSESMNGAMEYLALDIARAVLERCPQGIPPLEAMTWGYLACEKGWNIQKAELEFRKVLHG